MRDRTFNRFNRCSPLPLGLVLVASLLSAPACKAQTINPTQQYSFDTTGLSGYTGPFSVDLQLTDGNGIGDANTTIMLNNFAFGAGSPSGSPSLTGGATGNLSSGVTLQDSSFFNEAVQGFTPGSVLSFNLSGTYGVDVIAPDEFSFAILQGDGTEVTTTDPSGFNNLLVVDFDNLDSTQLTTQQYQIENQAPNAPVVPEASTFCQMLGGALPLGLWLGYRRRTRKSALQ